MRTVQDVKRELDREAMMRLVCNDDARNTRMEKAAKQLAEQKARAKKAEEAARRKEEAARKAEAEAVAARWACIAMLATFAGMLAAMFVML